MKKNQLTKEQQEKFHRGFTIDLLIADEAAFVPSEVFQAVTPALAARKGARIVLLSIPFERVDFGKVGKCGTI
jgi:hypothetical protein